MATVVVTIILRVSFLISKMDADRKVQRGHKILRQAREKRWSMNSEKLAAIVQELLKPISDLRHSFDLDQSGLLESYLSEAGIHMYDGSLDRNVPINFTELALLLQYSTSAYCRKVDLLYDKVLQCSTSLQSSTTEMADSGEGDVDEDGCDAEGGTKSRRRCRNELVLDDFTTVKLKPSTQAVEEPGCSRPPPTLPRTYIELGPRAMSAGDVALADYAGEVIGLLTDYYVGWALGRGQLMEQLATQSTRLLRPIELHELQQAIEARAPPPLDDIILSPDVPSMSPTPPPSPAPPPTNRHAMPPPAPPASARNVRKRKYSEHIKPDAEPLKLHIPKETLMNLPEQEVSIPSTWQQNRIKKRSLGIVTMRRTLREENPHPTVFPGWTEAEVSSTTVQCTTMNNTLSIIRLDESDDDGFFEQSSTQSDCPLNMSTILDSGLKPASIPSQSTSLDSEWLAWQTKVVQRAHDQEAKGFDVKRLADTVLDAVSRYTHSGERENSRVSDEIDVDSDPINSELTDNRTENDYGSDVCSFADILCDTACEPTDVSRLFLSTLFLANAGNVEIVHCKPLSVSSFGVRLLTKEDRLCKTSELLALTGEDRLCNSSGLLALTEENRLCNSSQLLALTGDDRLCNSLELLDLAEEDRLCNSSELLTLTEEDRLCNSSELLTLTEVDRLCNSSELLTLTEEDRLCNSSELLSLTEEERLCNSSELLTLSEEDRLCNSSELLALTEEGSFCNSSELLALTEENRLCDSSELLSLTEEDLLCSSSELLALPEEDLFCNSSELLALPEEDLCNSSELLALTEDRLCNSSELLTLTKEDRFCSSSKRLALTKEDRLCNSSIALTKKHRLCNTSNRFALTKKNGLCNSSKRLALTKEDRLCNSSEFLALTKQDRLCNSSELLALTKDDRLCNSSKLLVLTKEDRLCNSSKLLTLTKEDRLYNSSKPLATSTPLLTSNIKRRRR